MKQSQVNIWASEEGNVEDVNAAEKFRKVEKINLSENISILDEFIIESEGQVDSFKSESDFSGRKEASRR